MGNSDYIIRALQPEETRLLRDFLYEAIYLPEGTPPPPRGVIDLPELQVYIQDFGTRPDDHCLVAESSGRVIGAVWVRQMNDYGHIDEHTPSLAISLYPPFRGKGIGTRLMREMTSLLRAKGYKQVSLSVQKANPAVRLYRRLGFETVRETEEEYIMLYQCMKTNYQQFLSGEYCNHLDAEVLDMINRTSKLLTNFNSIETSEEKKLELLTQMFGSIGPHTSIGRNFTCQCGKHIFLGEKTVVNMNCTMMDENHIHIGNRVLIAPNVQFYTATHPIDACERFVSHWDETSGELFFRTRSLPITVGNDVWIGGGSIILPGVIIGNNCVIGAGSIVNKSIPANSVAVGNPCRVIRRLEPAVTFRPATVTDIPELKELFCSTVLTVNVRDYTAEEAADWASCGNRLGHWEKLMATLHFIAACDAEGRIVGFTSIRNDGYLHSMFVHKDHQGEGIATALLQRIEAYAMEHGICDITSEVSITARPFFERRGYVVEQEQRAQANRLKLTNYIMKKQLKKI